MLASVNNFSHHSRSIFLFISLDLQPRIKASPKFRRLSRSQISIYIKKYAPILFEASSPFVVNSNGLINDSNNAQNFLEILDWINLKNLPPNFQLSNWKPVANRGNAEVVAIWLSISSLHARILPCLLNRT